jgi:DNA-binding NtrC family response regulator
MAHALVVDADLEIQRCLSDIVRGEGMTLSLADSVRKGRIEIGRHRPNIAFINQSLPDGEGLTLISDLPGREQTATVLMAAKPSVETALLALRAGVFDFLPLPLELKRVHQALASLGVSPEAPPLGAGIGTDFSAEPGWFGSLLGRCPAMTALYDQLARVAPTSATVLLVGESGTGKELAAQTIHRLSRRARQPFFPLNCGAVSAQLIESELFGHERGSFTGADRQHKGFFERADGGTIFLDEVTEMPLELQVKLLRVLETGAFTRVGSVQPIQTNVRLISATNRIPEQAVQAGKLREDLYHRLNAFPVRLPPLRERIDDIELLATHFLLELNRSEGAQKRFGDGVLARWKIAPWPGNVRQLRNAVQRAFILADQLLTAEELPFDDETGTERTSLYVGTAVGGSLAPEAGSRFPSDRRGVVIRIGTSIDSAQRQLALATLVQCAWVEDRAAAMLGISLEHLAKLAGDSRLNQPNR